MEVAAQEYFNGPFLKENCIYNRQYQKNIVDECINKNSLVVLPTGLGKTIIGVLLIAHALQKYPNGKILVLAPTRPLISQHEASCLKFIEIPEKGGIVALTGKKSPEKRMFLFNNSQVIVSTPQVIKNDLERERYDLKHVSLIIFDEAHRTKGNYAYNFISTEYMNGGCSDPIILALTASPGKDQEHIQLICDNLFIENIIFKTLEDEDVKDYVNEVDIFVESVELPIKLLEISKIWDHLFKKFLKFFIDRGLINPNKNYYSKLDFLRISQDLTLTLQYENDYNSKNIDEDLFERLFFQSPTIIDIIREKKLNIRSIYSFCASCISILHAKDLIETQEISLFKSFLDKIQYKADQDILSSKRIANSKHYNIINSYIEKKRSIELIHPKIDRLISIIQDEISNHDTRKMIIFTQYREMADFLKNRLNNKFDKILICEKFIGQSTKIDDLGYSQRKQIETLESFRDGKVDILIATSVAEEGLDIPNVNAIIFYEPVPSEIRLIQRRGRTGRFARGRCYILIAEGTVDIPFYKVSLKKEEKMNEVLTCPEKLRLCDTISRNEIKFPPTNTPCSEFDFMKNFKERRAKEKEILADRSIEEIIHDLDDFKNSEEFIRLKKFGVSFFSDIINLNTSKLKNQMLKIKGGEFKPNRKKAKQYLNGNVKTLINLVNTYSENNAISFEKLQELAEDEDIIEKKFYAHLNQACYRGHLKRQGKSIIFIKDYD